jgi:adenylate cyclase
MLRFSISNKLGQQSFEHTSGPIEFGRGPEPTEKDVPRVVVQDGYVSKDHVRVDEQPDGQVRIRNLSQRNSIRLPDNSIIDKGETRSVRAPTKLVVGETAISIEVVVDPVASGPLETIASPVIRPKGAVKFDAALAAAATQTNAPPESKESLLPAKESLLDLGKAPTPERLMTWFETFVAVQQAAAGTPDFYRQTAEAVVKLVGLDRGLVILRAKPGTAPGGTTLPGQRWMVQARYPDDGNMMGREFSQTIIEKALKDRKTYFQSTAMPQSSESLQGVEAVVASPILDPQDDVVGFVYGCRTRFTAQRGLGVGPLEAQVMQVLAASVATGLARQQHESEASRARVQFEQFVSAEVAQELQKNPRLLEGQEREITVMFSDIRSFSRLSERLGPKLTCDLVADIMDRLTNCIRDCEGTVVDYAGDGLMAMWNAPATQPNHAALACKAALAMQAILPQVDADWHDRIGASVKVGIGVNTGPAMCGNTGSKSRFKYGPLGHAVNLASRVEGATKAMGVPVLITSSTKQHIGDTFSTRRLCKVRVVGIQGAVDFYELFAEQAPPEWVQRRNTYEEALGQFEQGQFGSACRTVYPLLASADGNFDVPCLNLVTRSVECIKYPPEKFDGIVELTSK